MFIRAKHIKALAFAVREAEGWRGSMTGNPDPEPLREFDARIKEMKEALRVVRAAQKREAAEKIRAFNIAAAKAGRKSCGN